MKLFTSATLKLAGWYLLILVGVSISFSAIVFQVTRGEIAARLTRLSEDDSIVASMRITPQIAQRYLEASTVNLLISLGYLNLLVLVGGGTGAYFLARRTLQPIEAAHDAQSRFVANASHQLRTPLAIMKAETELVLDDVRATKQNLRETLASNLEEINHLSDLSGMLLALSKGEQALKQPTGNIDLVATLHDIITQRQVNRRTTLQTPNSLTLYTHEVAIREILSILLDNAIKHSPEDSPITITLTPEKQSILYTITNTGQGIRPDELPHIFERFYRRGSADGYGLGLSLAKQLVRALGGTISVTSAQDALTTFTVSLPKS